MIPLHKFAASVAAAAMLTVVARAQAWSHQGHILITRMAALRIINDATAPEGLRDFLKQNMKSSMDGCRGLAIRDVVGTPQNPVGLDNFCTMPDRIQALPEGREPIAPFGAAEPKMHFLDIEYFAGDQAFHQDLSGLPKAGDIPEDAHDPRYRLAGFSPLRIQQCYENLVQHFKQGWATEPDADPGNPDPDTTLRWAGYLAHYVEDATQPHHSTIDYKSYSFLYGHVSAVHKKTVQTAGGPVVDYICSSKTVNPHGDIEYQLFENASEPRESFRQRFWQQLTTDVDLLAKSTPAPTAHERAFTVAVASLRDGHHYLPLVGHAAMAAYSESGTFDPKAFFGFQEPVDGKDLSVIDLIALQNAKAVLNVERLWRQAWRDGRTAP